MLLAGIRSPLELMVRMSLDRGRHDQGGQRELARAEPLDHFLDQVDVLGLGQIGAAQEVLDQQPVQDAHAQSPATASVWSLATSAMRARPASVSRASVHCWSFWVKRPKVPWSLPVSMSSQTSLAASGPWPAGRVVKRVAQPGGQLAGGHGRQAAEEPVGGQHDQARVFHGHAHHQHEVGRMVGRQAAVCRRPGRDSCRPSRSGDGRRR